MRERLLIDVAVGDTVQFTLPSHNADMAPQEVHVTVEKKSGQVARLRIRAAESVAIRPPQKKRLAVPG